MDVYFNNWTQFKRVCIRHTKLCIIVFEYTNMFDQMKKYIYKNIYHVACNTYAHTILLHCTLYTSTRRSSQLLDFVIKMVFFFPNHSENLLLYIRYLYFSVVFFFSLSFCLSFSIFPSKLVIFPLFRSCSLPNFADGMGSQSRRELTDCS